MLKYFQNKISLVDHFTVVSWFLILSFAFDFIDKIEIFYRIDFIKFNKYIKLVILIYALTFIIIHIKYLIIHLKFVLYTYLVLSIILLIKINHFETYFDEYIRYAFIFFLFPLLSFIFFQSKQNNLNYKLYILLKYFIVLNSIAIILGMLLDIYVFKTYKGERFGYNGFILSQGITPYIYLFATAIFYSFRNYFMIFLTLILAIISGVKGAYFAEFLFITLLVLSNNTLSKKYKAIIAIILSLLFGFLIFALLSLSPFKELINSKGLLSAIFSLRSDNLLELFNEITIKNFNVFVGATGITPIRLELQIIDVLLTFGAIGIVAFCYFYGMVFIKFIKENTSKAVFITAILLSLLSGNLFYIPLASLLFILTLFSLNENNNKRINNIL